MKRWFRPFISVLLTLPLGMVFLTAPHPASAQEIETVEPVLNIPIPNVQFSKALQEGQNLTLPFIGEYISGVYTFLVSIVGVVAGAMILIGGYQYLTAGGEMGRVNKAKERILNALTGLALVLGSYLILYTINPALVSFESLNFQVVESDPFFQNENTGVDLTVSDIAVSVSGVSICPNGEDTLGTNGVIMWKQWDKRWRDTPYGDCGEATMRSSACGPTSAAMVMHFYGKDVNPVSVAQLFDQAGFRVCGGGTRHTAMVSERTVGQHGLKGELIKGAAHELTEQRKKRILQLLRNDRPIVAGMRKGSIFTAGGHYVVLTGLDAQGNFLINDPNKCKYERYPPFRGSDLGQELPQPLTGGVVPPKYVWEALRHANYIYDPETYLPPE